MRRSVLLQMGRVGRLTLFRLFSFFVILFQKPFRRAMLLFFSHGLKNALNPQFIYTCTLPTLYPSNSSLTNHSYIQPYHLSFQPSILPYHPPVQRVSTTYPSSQQPNNPLTYSHHLSIQASTQIHHTIHLSTDIKPNSSTRKIPHTLL